MRRWIREGNYDEIEREIRRLLVAAQPGRQRQLPAVSELASTFAKMGQPSYAGITNETYIGAERREPGAVTIKGDWHTDRQYVELKKGSGEIVVPFMAGEANLVMQSGPSGRTAATQCCSMENQSATRRNGRRHGRGRALRALGDDPPRRRRATATARANTSLERPWAARVCVHLMVLRKTRAPRSPTPGRSSHLRGRVGFGARSPLSDRTTLRGLTQFV